MKKILLIIIGLALAMPAWAAQTAVTQISGTQASIGALKTQVNAKLGTVESNRQDHETRVAAMETGLASQSAFTTAWGWNPGDNLGSATAANVSSLFSGAGDCLKSDGTKGDCGTGSSLPAWFPSTGPTDGRQILQATGGCSNATYNTQATCEAASATWTPPVYTNTSIISGLINDTGTADDDLWSAAKITSELAGKQTSLGFTPENAAQKGAANGYAGLDSNGKVPTAQLPTLGTTYDLPSLADAQAGTSTTPYVWSPQRVAQAIAALAPSGGATSLQMTFVSDDSLETQTGSKTKVPTGVDFTTADIGCDVSDSITFTLSKSSTVNGTYSAVGTISVSAAAQNESIDISSWANLTAGDWVRIDLTTAGTTAKECTVVIGGTEL